MRKCVTPTPYGVVMNIMKDDAMTTGAPSVTAPAPALVAALELLGELDAQVVEHCPEQACGVCISVFDIAA